MYDSRHVNENICSIMLALSMSMNIFTELNITVGMSMNTFIVLCITVFMTMNILLYYVLQ